MSDQIGARARLRQKLQRDEGKSAWFFLALIAILFLGVLVGV